MTAPTQEPIRTRRLTLREIEPPDAEAVLAFMSLPRVMQYTTRLPLVRLDQATTYLAERTSGPNMYNFAVTLNPASLTMGTKPHDMTPDNPTDNTKPHLIGLLGSPCLPEIGYLFHPDYSGMGYATEALEAFLSSFFARLPCDYAEAQVDVENGASIRLLERCGFSRGEVEAKAYVSPLLKEERDSVCYRMARPGVQLADVLGTTEKEEDSGFVPDLQ